MAWNDDGNGKDPWQRDGQQPADLDQVVKEWQKRFGSILGGGGAAGGVGGVVLALVLIGVWLATGFYRVDEAERGVVQRFGAFTETTMPGLRWHLPYPIETVDRVNTTAISNYAYRTEMLTADEQYVFIDMVVQFRRADPVKYSFEVVDPDMTLQDVTESALREVVGTSTLESLIAGRRDEIASRTREVLQATLDSYGEGAGITVTSISLENVNYPQAVQAAVDDAQKARNDSERFILEADEYYNNIVPKAQGDAARILEEARGYKEQLVAFAEGEANRFEALLTEYQKAPRVTRDRLYLEAIEEVYGNSAKVLIDTDGGNLLYLPLNEIMNRSGIQLPRIDTGSTSDTPVQGAPQDVRESSDARERRTRQ
ncbi:MAG: FtsH protease activity modulator HflK [Gammaproteobacteria bacterium]|nr:FtsH protease activity modulator HflK [Gammaproteobacteria bacterium]NNF50261.1 FtsH protease activity modulator HflK [Woeseiaceae bacterium]MBT8095223.1 FtsH protease activity modulator HflK [Gammaproteobacteria bacterium]MBT8105632.1 FtsH protease activity modulator HflK [Gammaproteobacteria bacterium]NNK25646.1 FtsH protease activity modulator HflK [Woeseiaceae bacterium]